MRGNGAGTWSDTETKTAAVATGGAPAKDRKRQRKARPKEPRVPLGLSSAAVIGLVFLPFVTGFYLSYVFRTIPALIADSLARDLGLSPADLGLLASMYFLAFGLVQLPLGIWLDRYGPRRVQTILLSIAAAGALLFAFAQGFATLLLARTLIGLGVAGALMGGLKAVVLWFPADRIAFANGWFIMIGALGAVTATAPAEHLLASLGWRGLFVMLAGLTALSALLIFALVPEHRGAAKKGQPTMSLGAIYRDRRFWRLAPLSATVIGSAWALQGLWAAPWLSDVEKLGRRETVTTLLLMACALSFGAVVLGTAADRLRRFGITSDTVLGSAAALSLLAQLALVLRWPVPPVFPWLAIAALGAGTVLSYAILADTFPKAASGRANGALNVLHVATAFAVQAGIGFAVELWPPENDRPPVAAFQTAFAANLLLQTAAFAWFIASAAPRPKLVPPGFSHPSPAKPPPLPYDVAIALWVERVQSAQTQAAWWRCTAIGSALLLVLLAGALAGRLATPSIVHVVDGRTAKDRPAAIAPPG